MVFNMYNSELEYLHCAVLWAQPENRSQNIASETANMTIISLENFMEARQRKPQQHCGTSHVAYIFQGSRLCKQLLDNGPTTHRLPVALAAIIKNQRSNQASDKCISNQFYDQQPQNRAEVQEEAVARGQF